MSTEKMRRIMLVQFGLSLMLFSTGIFVLNANKVGSYLIMIAIFTLLLLLQDLKKEGSFFANALGVFCSSLFIIILTKKIPDSCLKLSKHGIVPVMGLVFVVFAVYLIFVHMNMSFKRGDDDEKS